MTVSANPEWDVIVIGSGIGGLVTASQLAAKGAKTLVLERYLIPGGSGGSFKRDGYTFDVGASMIFGFGEHGHTNLLTRALRMWGSRVKPFLTLCNWNTTCPMGSPWLWTGLRRLHRPHERSFSP